MENCVKLISYLLHSRTQVHIFHLQTPSFAEHKALSGYYDDIVGLVDELVESYQGKYGIVKGYLNFNLHDYETSEQVIGYLEALSSKITVLRKDIQDSYIQNQVDNVEELIRSTLYKLKFLK